MERLTGLGKRLLQENERRFSFCNFFFATIYPKLCVVVIIMNMVKITIKIRNNRKRLIHGAKISVRKFSAIFYLLIAVCNQVTICFKIFPRKRLYRSKWIEVGRMRKSQRFQQVNMLSILHVETFFVRQTISW